MPSHVGTDWLQLTSNPNKEKHFQKWMDAWMLILHSQTCYLILKWHKVKGHNYAGTQRSSSAEAKVKRPSRITTWNSTFLGGKWHSQILRSHNTSQHLSSVHIKGLVHFLWHAMSCYNNEQSKLSVLSRVPRLLSSVIIHAVTDLFTHAWLLRTFKFGCIFKMLTVSN